MGYSDAKTMKRVVLKRVEPPRPVTTVRYVECQKNHAAAAGGHIVDGCREFIPSGAEGTDAAFTCAACGCHRNFHRRVES
ncbi:hypothetical protein ERO13_A05G365900v2 [Gossypium hirsutum]|uniref:ZF-HD dimerization-type domain-containing protein n=8 Tax=Gossypium TaxID=3633 RepID=A0A5J5VZF5_GOSBA|nr:hypothetical protein ES319_A05G385300v1 [Gossypium barbadense]KAG4202894.1 hypothetical protein ERO13_A05G365900v2 [Gossypium hirsutum]TYH20171.1 hypothetical protein ES288_A05G409800v1 [Gossypium darwinii]TYI30792.1 hypothetical protein ES332_A05G412000v1 [Gossypium tomentosum]